MTAHEAHQRLRRSLWATLALALGFAVLISFVARYFLIPAMEAARHANPAERRTLSAYALLLMAIVLMMVLVGIILTFRVRRFFLPKISHEPTKYVDAWAESGRRLEDLPEEEQHHA